MRKITLFLIMQILLLFSFANAANWYVASAASSPYTGSESNTGTTQDSPKLLIATAIGLASSGDVINIAAGTYTESNLNPGDKSLTFQGAGISSSIIQAYTNPTSTSGSSTNTAGVFVKTNAATTASTLTFSGLTIQNGSNISGGSGILVSSGTNYLVTLSFTNIQFKDNLSNANSVYGGAVYLNAKTNATFNNCIFTTNKNKYNGGGGAIAIGTIGPTILNINNCYFNNNQSGNKGGGAIYNISSNNPVAITIKNSTFYNNQTNVANAVVKGGALNITAGATSGSNTLWIENSTFNNNKATYTGSVGGAIYYSASAATNNFTLNHCTITGNTTNAGTGGDGVCINSAGAGQTNLVMNNSIIIGNSGSTSNQSQVGTNATDQSKITNVGITNCILGGASTSGTFGIVGTWIDANTTHNTLTAGTNELAFGALSSDATPVLPIGNASIARNYVTTNYLDPVLSADQIGQSRKNASDAGAYENQLIQYTIAASATTGGTIISGAGDYDNGANCTVVASANTGYNFVNWTEGETEVSTSLSYTFTVSTSRTLVANFAASATPELSVSTTTLSNFVYTPSNGPSASKSFTITGANLSSDVTITSSTNFEVSSDNSSFGASASLLPTSGSLTVVPVYVRLKSGLETNTAYSESVSVSATGVTEQTVSCSGRVTDVLPSTAASNAIVSNTLHTTTDLSWTAGDVGAKYLVLVSTNADVATAYLPVASTTYTVGSTTHDGYIVGYVGSAISANVSGLTAGTSNYLAVFTYNDKSGTAGFENYLTSSPATTSVTTIVASASNDHFRTFASGNWSATSAVWESSTDGSNSWHKSNLSPGSSATGVNISTGNTITITASPTVSSMSMQDGSFLIAGANAITIPSTTFAGTTTSISGGSYYNTVVNGMTAQSGVKVSLSSGFNHSGDDKVALNFAASGTLSQGSELELNGTSTDNRIGMSSASTSYLANTLLNLKGNVLFIINANAGSSTTINVGSLSGASGSRLGWQKTSGLDRNVTWSVGANNENSNFAGTITNLGGYAGSGSSYTGNYTHLTKVGTGTLTLSGTSTAYNGNLTVNDGELNITGAVSGSSRSGDATFPSTVSVAAGKKLSVSGSLTATNLTLNSDANGTATLVNTGSVTISNPATVQQYLSSARNWYVSSPVTGATVPTGMTFYSYDESGSNTSTTYPNETAYWVGNPEGTTLTVGKGYIAIPSAAGAIQYSGTLNNGTTEVPITVNLTRTAGKLKEGFNLVGNPFPSYLDWEAVEKTNVGTTMWYRSRTTAQTPVYQFDTYNAVSHIGVGNSGTDVTNHIPPMQAFWVLVDAGQTTGSLSFKNTMSSHKGSQTVNSVTTNDPLLKVSSLSTPIQQVLRLKVSNGVNSDETVVLFNENASNGFDVFDSYKMTNNNVAIPEIYTVVDSKKLVINGFDNMENVNNFALGFETGQSNTFTIQATEISNFGPDVQVVLKDNETGNEVNFSQGETYNFTSNVTTGIDRFTVLFKSSGVATGLAKNDLNGIDISTINKQIVVKSTDATLQNANVSVFDALGQKLMESNLNDSELYIRVPLKGMYLVSVTSNGHTYSQKVMMND